MENNIKSLVEGLKKSIDESNDIQEIKELVIGLIGVKLGDGEKEIYFNNIYKELESEFIKNPEDIIKIRILYKKIIDDFVKYKG